MAISAKSVAGAAAATFGVILLAIGTPAAGAEKSALAGEVSPIAPAPSIVAGSGVTLRSVSIDLPDSGRTFHQPVEYI
jgi:hypothetical protein